MLAPTDRTASCVSLPRLDTVTLGSGASSDGCKGGDPGGYREEIQRLLASSGLPIDADIVVGGRPPTLASSEFLTNREQGLWAEELALRAINLHSDEYRAVRYGEADSISAGDPDFASHYTAYQAELNEIGKRPDILVFRKNEVPEDSGTLTDPAVVGRAVAALEVRSSSFLATEYSSFMIKRTEEAQSACADLLRIILAEPYSSLLASKNPVLYEMLKTASPETFRELDFRRPSWRSTEDLRNLTDLLRRLKECIKILHRRDYLSITPKLEDIALVNRWIQKFGVRHYYLQVFFDKAYLISFKNILEIVSDPAHEGEVFSIEGDVKNQNKTTVKVNIAVGQELLGRIDMPEHQSAMKRLERGRLLFYVRFEGGLGYLCPEDLRRAIEGDD